MTEFPKQRLDDLVVTRTQGEMLVYDERSAGLHTINATMASVWEACDGQQSVSQIALVTGLDQSLVNTALDGLSQAQLLESTWASAGQHQSRRRLLKKAGMGVAVAVPTIISVTAPAAANHQSGQCHPGGTPCSVDDDCCPGASSTCQLVWGAGNYCGGFVA